jgi:hypothetical protein
LNLRALSEKLDAFLFRRETRSLTEQDLQMAEEWALTVIRQHHPDWEEERVRRYYDGLLRVRVYVVDEWGRRMN